MRASIFGLILMTAMISGPVSASGGVPGTDDCTLPRDGQCPIDVNDWRFQIKLEEVGKKLCGIQLQTSRPVLTENALPFADDVFAWSIGGDILTRGPKLLSFRGDTRGFALRVQAEKPGGTMTLVLAESAKGGVSWPEFIDHALFLSPGQITVSALPCPGVR